MPTKANTTINIDQFISGVPSEDVAPEPAGVTVAVGVIVKIIRKIEAGVKRG